MSCDNVECRIVSCGNVECRIVSCDNVSVGYVQDSVL